MHSLRWTGWIGLPALAGAVGVAFLLCSPVSDDAATMSATGAPDTSMPGLPPDLERFANAAIAIAPEPSGEVVESASAEPATALRVPETRIELYGNGELVTATPNGELSIRYRGTPEALPPIPVIGGRCRLPVGDEPYDFVRIVLEGREASAGLSSCDSGAPSWMIATWIPHLALHARDAENGSELEHVTVVRGDHALGEHNYPTRWERNGSTLVNDKPSALTIPVPRAFFRNSPVTFFVGARGHAWRPLMVELGRNATAFVDLPRTGSVEVSFDGHIGEPLTIDMRPLDGAPLIAQLDTSDGVPLEIDDLEPGLYRLVAQWSDWPDEAPVVATNVIEVRPGARARVTLTIPEPVGHRLVTGVLDVAAGWGSIDEPELLFREVGAEPNSGARMAHIAGATSERPGEEREYQFTAALSRARHVASITDLRFVALVVVPPIDSGPIRIRVPPPADVRLRVVDDAGVDVDDSATVSWQSVALCDAPNPAPTSVTGRAHRADDGRYEFRAPAGIIDVSVALSEFMSLRRRIAISPGANEVTVQLERAAVVVVTVARGQHEVLERTTFASLDGRGEVLERIWIGGGDLIVRLTPGPWRVSLADAKVASKDVTAVKGQSTKVEFETE